MESATSKFDKEKLGERIAALSGGIARIMVGSWRAVNSGRGRLAVAALWQTLFYFVVQRFTCFCSASLRSADWRVYGN